MCQDGEAKAFKCSKPAQGFSMAFPAIPGAYGRHSSPSPEDYRVYQD